MFDGERFSALLKDMRLSQAELARRVGVSQATIWKLTKEPSQGSKHIHRIARELGTTPEYLMGESDVMSAAAAPPAVFAPSPPADDDSVEVEAIDLAYGMGGTFIDEAVVEVEKLTFTRSWLRNFTHSPPDLLFVARGAGDSMTPTIGDSDIVLVDRSQTRPQMRDQIWAMTMAGVGMIKRLRPMTDGTMLIMSDNPSVSDDRATDGELFIVGRVVAIVRKV